MQYPVIDVEHSAMAHATVLRRAGFAPAGTSRRPAGIGRLVPLPTTAAPTIQKRETALERAVSLDLARSEKVNVYGETAIAVAPASVALKLGAAPAL